MTTLLNFALINAVTVLPLAVLAFLVGRTARRPALTHALWVLVLLKFVTPPLFQLPVTIEMPVAEVGRDVSRASDMSATRSEFAVANEPIEEVANGVARPESSKGVADSNASNAHALRKASGRATHTPSLFERMMASCSMLWAQRPDARWTLLGVWLGGSALWLGVQLVRAVRFQRRVLRGAITSSELQRQTDRLAGELRLRQAPQVLIVDAAISPMLWGCGARAKLLFPADLAERLDESARATLITHELAHFTRGDHWVRLLELIATGAFWWHPVVWIAKQQIEAAEEECCDAWVVGQFPETPKLYAEALLDTIDYLCERRQALPPVACGLGQAHFLRHRLTKIMRGAAPKAMSRRVRIATALVAAVLLPLQPFVFGSARIVDSLSLPIMEPIATLDAVSAIEPVEPNEAKRSAASPNEATVAPKKMAVAASTRIPSLRGEKTWSTAASSDGRFVVRTTTARRLILTDRNSNHETDLSVQQVTAVAFVPDAELFVAADSDGRMTLCDAASGKWLRTVLNHSEGLRSIAVSPRGDAVAAGGRDGSVLLCDLATGEPIRDLPSYPSAVNCVRFSPDGNQLAVAVGEWSSEGRGSVELLDTSNGQTIAKLECDSAPGAVSFASNEELIIGLWNGHAQLWNLNRRQVVGSANANKNIIAAAAFSPDNPALLEVTFEANVTTTPEPSSPISLLQRLFGNA